MFQKNKRSILIVPYTLFILAYMGFLLYFLTINPGGKSGNPLVVYVLTAFASGGMIMMAIYGLTLYMFRHREKAALYFSLLCISAGVRFFCMEGSETVRNLIPAFPASGTLFIRYFTVSLLIIGYHGFVYEIFIKPKHKITMYVLNILALAVLIACGIIGAVQGYDNIIFRLCSFFITFIVVVYLIIQIYRSPELKKNRLNWLYFVSLLIYFTLTVIVGFLNHIFPHTAVLSNSLMVIVHVILLSQRYSRTIDDNELLDKLNRTKSELFATISHNMKTPLTIIATDIQLAEKFSGENQIDKSNELLQEAWQETMKLADQVTDAINISRQSESYSDMSYIDFTEVIEPVLKMYEPIIKKQGNTLVSDIEKAPKIQSNAQMLTSALTNILDNANRHTKNGLINVSLNVMDNECCLEISDTGEGIAPELLPRVFDRGVSGADSSGLGLAIVKSIMELHNGKVELESDDKGTIVKLFFKFTTNHHDYLLRSSQAGNKEHELAVRYQSEGS